VFLVEKDARPGAKLAVCSTEPSSPWRLRRRGGQPIETAATKLKKCSPLANWTSNAARAVGCDRPERECLEDTLGRARRSGRRP
jgi:hypothetical protein